MTDELMQKCINVNNWVKTLKKEYQMYQRNPKVKTSLKGLTSRQGETIERKLERMMKNGADLGETGEMIFTERNDGVIPETDIRSDRHEIAVDAADAMSQLHLTKRDERHNPKPKEGDGEHKSGPKIE